MVGSKEKINMGEGHFGLLLDFSDIQEVVVLETGAMLR